MAPTMLFAVLLAFIPGWGIIALLICVAAVWHWRGVWQVLAVIPLLILVLALLGDISSAAQGGNLTGVLTYLGSIPAMVILFLLWAGKTIASAVDGTKTEGASPPEDEAPDK
jgi:hypothetical protein